MMRAGDALSALRRELAASPSADLDAELLLAHVLGTGRAGVKADPARLLSAVQAEALSALAQRRAAGEPVAYLTGHREFWSLDLEVTPDVLVPRPETELVVELALDALESVARPAVLDLGTGSGAIAIAIAHERPDAVVTAVDASAAALAVAAANARRLRAGNVAFHAGSWYEPVGGLRFDCIVSNPPYIADDDPALASLSHEPRGALVAGAAGLDALAVVCAGAPVHLAAGGTLIVEHGATQGPGVCELMTRAGLAGVATHADLAGRPRATRGNSPRPALQSGSDAGGVNAMIRFETTLGDFTVELDAELAPISCKNFLRYVDDGYFDGTVFHRVIPGFMVQGGGFTADMQQKPTHEPITNEADNGLRNRRGAIAMARTNDLHSATAQFFINLVDNGFLDHRPGNYGYAVFGRVAGGMDVIDKIAAVKTGRRGGHDDVPLEPVVIKLARRASAA